MSQSTNGIAEPFTQNSDAFGLEKVMFLTVPGPPATASARGWTAHFLAACSWYARSLCIGIILFAPTPAAAQSAASASAARDIAESLMATVCP